MRENVSDRVAPNLRPPTTEAVQEQLCKILRSPLFARSAQMAKLLEFLVEETLKGNSENLKGYVIAIDVLGRRESFDPKLSTIVRSEARRLREKLAVYYRGEGENDPLEITLPKGSYVPKFEYCSVDELTDETRTLFAGYRIIEELASEGLGRVYRAEDHRLHRAVALKMLPASSSGAKNGGEPAEVLAAQLDHPNICTVYEAGVFEGQAYIASAFIAGENLGLRLERGRLELRTELEIGIEIAEGLVAAHSHGIVHCDLKPSNILIANDGPTMARVKIIDFGISRKRYPTEPVEPTERFGTLAYMSPEQFEGERFDGRTDIWSLGVVMYEVLTGRLPFHGENTPTLRMAILHGELRFPDDPELKVDPEMERILRKCLEKAPGDRYQSADALLLDLRFLSGSAVPGFARAGGSGPVASYKPDSHPVWSRWPLFAATIVVAIAAVVWDAYQGEPLPPETRRFTLDSMPVLTRGDRMAGLRISPDGRSLAYISGEQAERRLWVRRLAADGPINLGPLDNRVAAWCPESDHLVYIRGGAIVKAAVYDDSGVITLAELPPDVRVRAVAWAEDGAEIFYVTEGLPGRPENALTGTLWKIPNSGGEPQVVTTDEAQKTGRDQLQAVAQIIPGTGSRLLLASTRSQETWVVDVESGRSNYVSDGIHPVYSPTGHILVHRDGVPAQAVNATQASKRSAGVSNSSVLRGRPFSLRAILSRCSCECTDKSVPLGKYCLSNPLVFSLEPLCQGLCGSQKYTSMSVARVKRLWSAISSPRSQVSDL